MIYSVTIFLVI